MEKRWVENNHSDKTAIDRLAGELNVNAVVASLLIKRGIHTFDQARDFFRPSILHLHDPFLMKDMELAINRINKAITHNERILIYGDYDVDGTTSVALTYTFFKTQYDHLDFYIPDRYKEGYGISTAGIDFAKEHGFSLIIALDCGIKANDKVAYANSLGIDFIICDHHLPGDTVPDAIAVLDPKQKDCEYPYDELSGCGIGFKLVQAYCQFHQIDMDTILPLLDLVAVSIASDIVPLTGENRTLAYFGLQQLNSNPRPGFKALMNIAATKTDLSINEIVFAIGPRINAAGRIDDAKHAVNLLISKDEQSAFDFCEIVDSKNTERREFDQSITLSALQLIEENFDLHQKKSTVLFDASWHKGVIGIVASRLIEKHYKPTIILTESNGLAAGSARSVNGFDIYEAISACSDLLIQYGGHKYAAGLTMQIDQIPAFQEKFEEIVAASIHDDSLQAEIAIECEMNLAEFSTKTYAVLKQFAPFGPGNMKPVFISSNVQLASPAQLVGKQNNNHLKFSVVQQGSYAFDCIAFGLGNLKDKLVPGIPFDICYTIEENTWREKTSIQLNIKDIRIQS